jgi:hypothetical protein
MAHNETKRLDRNKTTTSRRSTHTQNIVDDVDDRKKTRVEFFCCVFRATRVNIGLMHVEKREDC